MKSKLKNKIISWLVAAMLVVGLLPVISVPAMAATITFSGGSGTSANPYQITTAAQLASLAAEVNAGNTTYNAAYYKLMNDITLTGNWTPIGTYDYQFKGSFDGGGRVISGLNITGSALTYVGLFGYVGTGGIVKNLGVTAVVISTTHSGGAMSGGLVGYSKGQIINCYTTGSVSSSSSTSSRVGGLVGYNEGGAILNCYSTATAYGTAGASGAHTIGGLVGTSLGTSSITNCYAAGTGTGSGGSSHIGGLMGSVADNTITNCYWNNARSVGYNGTSTVTGSSAMATSSMQTSAFATTLNNNRSTNTGWGHWEYISGYPTFKTMTVTYSANNGSLGSVPSSQFEPVVVGGFKLSSASPTRTNYTFLGWSASSSATTATYAAGASYTGEASITLYAVWQGNTYSITLNQNNATTNGATSFNATYGSVPSQITSRPARTGYTFNGYWTATSGGTQVFDSSGNALASAGSYTNASKQWIYAGTTTLYAQWTANTYTVTNSITNTTLTPSGTGTATYGTAYSGTLTANTGYTRPSSITMTIGGTASSNFTYNSSTGAISVTGTYVTGAIVISGTATLNTYTVTNSITNTTLTPLTATHGTAYSGTLTANTGYTRPSSITMTIGGTSFSGFTYNNSTGAISIPAANVTGAIVINGTASLITYTVAYDANGGSSAPTSQTKSYGVSLTLSSTIPTRTGYTFKNWNTVSGGTGTTYASGAAYTANTAATLYAQWTANTYYIRFNANGGTGTMSNQTFAYGTAQALTHNTFSKEGHTFMGWDTDPAGVTVIHGNGKSILNLTAENNATLDLYAVWTIDANILTIDYNDNATADTIIERDFGTTIDIPDPTRSGYIFDGWTHTGGGSISNGDSSIVYTFGSSAGKLTAKWVSKKQTAIYDQTTTSDFTVQQQSNLDAVYDRVVTAAEKVSDSIVTLSLEVNDITSQNTETDAIKQAADKGSEVYFFDVTLTKQINNEAPTTLTNIPIPVEVHIKLTGDLAGKAYYKVYRYHGGMAEQILNDTSKTEHYVVDIAASEIIIYTMKFSTYAIFGNDVSLQDLSNGGGEDMDVQAKITDASIGVYKVDIAWGAMTFEWNAPDQIYNPDTHEWENNANGGAWTDASHNGENNRIVCANHSNGSLLATIDVAGTLGGVTYAMVQTNENTGTAAMDMTLPKVTVAGDLDAPEIEAYLWLSGTPEGLSSDVWDKVGVITITFTPDGTERTPKN